MVAAGEPGIGRGIEFEVILESWASVVPVDLVGIFKDMCWKIVMVII